MALRPVGVMGQAMAAAGRRSGAGRVPPFLTLGLCLLPVALLADPYLQAVVSGAWWPVAALAGAVTWLGYGTVDVGILLALAAFESWRGRRAAGMRAVLGGGVVAVAGLLSQVLKNLACRGRPTAVDPAVFFSQFPCFPAGYAVASFPSGHATTAFAAAVLLAIWYPRGAPAFLGLAALVALSRVVLGSHFASDVLAGALLGSFVAAAALARLPSLRRGGGA